MRCLGTVGATGEVESWDSVEWADIPQRDVQTFKEFACAAPDAQSQCQGRDEQYAGGPREQTGAPARKRQAESGPQPGQRGHRDACKPRRR